jgi:hypothetical protein
MLVYLGFHLQNYIDWRFLCRFYHIENVVRRYSYLFRFFSSGVSSLLLSSRHLGLHVMILLS